ncbi:octopamine receptor Oamb isoform X2 [Lucilia sericata]|uniref:octopamine receptor Oamb isoform X2 n=1 Tax=Lucilia sericata TaxID=13632 RepID=UPI0018A7EBC2|nr:octopamine receptor Oamb isoform X2 [Lucilia sericata]
MNETECDNLIKSVKWTEPSNLISLAILEFINVLVIGGNLLVIAAVFCSNKLRSVTNFFIVNLAVADLLVGLAVLPFSATWEVFKVWIFGDVWCRIWLAVDVWMCTASILNLCAISLDRYVAVTRPVTYPSIMSTKKAKSLIAGIWVLSFVICFPPLVGWKDQKPMLQPTYTRGNYTLYYATSATTISSESSSTTTTSSSLIGVVAPTSTSPSLKHKGKRQRKFLKTTTNAPYTIHSSPATAPVSIAKALRHTRRTSAKSSSSSLYTSSSLYNSFNPYDPYYAHLQNHNTGDKNVNNRVAAVDDDDNSPAGINDNNSNYNYHYSNENADADNSKVAGADDTSATDLVDDDEYTLTTSDSSESSSIRYNNDPTSAMYYDTADSGRVMMNGAETLPTTTTYTSSPSSMSSYAAPPPPCPWKCELTNDRGYVLYSALGSFYIPMFVMLFFYWRIYRAAVRTTRAINQGFKTTKGSKGIGSRFDEQRLTLRIHRGRGSNQHDSTHSNGSTQSTTTTLGTPSPERLSKYSTRRQHNNHDKIKISVSYPSNDNISELAHGHDSIHHLERGREHRASSASSGNMLFAVHYGSHNGRDCNETQLYRHQHQHDSSCYLQVGKNMPDMLRRTSNTSEHQQNRPNKKMGKRNIKAQVKRFRMETKAAKTLAIIVGLFIFCWLPFFTMYIIRPFCEDCIDPLLFSVLFWLGYCNSAVNPMIYALFSKDFRFAFKRIICKCFCSGKSINMKTSRRGSDMSAIRIRARTPSITPSAAAHSFGDESELHHSEMSSNDR